MLSYDCDYDSDSVASENQPLISFLDLEKKAFEKKMDEGLEKKRRAPRDGLYSRALSFTSLTFSRFNPLTESIFSGAGCVDVCM